MRVVSGKNDGHHLGLIVFDEPAQHSMGVSSLHSLLSDFSLDTKEQTIVGASFDESDDVFKRVVEGLDYCLITLKEKLIQPL